MSQMNTTSQNLPNGLPPQAMSINKPNAMPPEKPLQYQHPFNGIGSSHSSRDSSPSSFLRNIPSSQLPPTVSNIPATQLPPVRHSVNANQLAQNYSQLRISTPASSPKPSGFNTSTPNEQYGSGSVSNTQKPIQTSTANFSPKSSFSPITSNVQSSVTNNYSNVALNAGSNTQVDGSRSIESNKYTANISNKPTEQTLQPPNVSLSSHFADVQKQTFTQPVLPPQQMVQSVNVQNVGKISQVPKMPVTNTFQQGHHQTLPTNLANYPSQGNASQGSSEKSIQSSSYLQSGQTVQQPFQVPTQINPKQNHAGYGPPLNVSQNQILPPNASVYNNSSMPQNTARPDFANRNPPVNGPPLSSNMTNNASSIAQPNLYSSPSYSQPPANVPYNFHQQNIPNSVAQLNPNQTTRPSMYPKKYPQQQQQQQYSNNNVSLPPPPPTHLNQQQGMFQNQSQYSNQAKPSPYRQNFEPPNVTQSGFNKLWNQENYDLLQCPNILPTTKIQPTKVSLGQEFLDAANCSPEIFRCTMTKIPETSTLLQKSRLPLGVLIHPFKDLNHLPVIQCNVIVRCRACRTYINPFVFFVDSKRWKCNLCYRINDLPEEFQYDPVSKTYGDPSRRPEIRSSTIEYIAPAEYMLRPPQPAVYLFLLDISQVAVECGYLHTFCNVLAAELTKLPGDARTQVGFMAYDSALHFFSLGEGLNQPHEMIVLDIDEVFLPCPDNLLVNLKDRMELVQDLLTQLPTRYENSYDNGSALGAALQAAHKLMAATGGRVTVFQATLPTIGPGALLHREDPNNRASSEAPHLNPANDFYKRLALECSGQQIAVDLFIVNSQYVDIATISGISRFSGGCIHHFPLFKASRTLQSENLERCFRRYLTRKIGFEAVMRIRCTRGLSIHTFHGNFFVRSTDLLSLPNVNPDAGFGMQVSIDESLSDVQSVCFQAALLYTSSKGERRIRVHTLCLPVVSTLNDVIHSADQQCIVGLLAKMAVDRSMQSSLSDAREAFINVAIDILSSYKLSLNLGSGMSGLLAPNCLKLLPLYICALLKHVAFRTGTSTRLDDRVKAMCDMKTRPLSQLIQNIYPDLYPVHNLDEHRVVLGEDDEPIPQPPHLQLTARSLEAKGAFLMDMGEHMVIFVCSSVSTEFLNNALNVPNYASIPDEMCELPQLENTYNRRLHSFINYLNEDKPFVASLQIMKENSVNRSVFFERLIEDRIENALSYHEFLQHIKTQVK